MNRKKIVLFGGGPACLFAADMLAQKHQVVLYEKGKNVGRKFLVAGNGGFNLTNSAVGNELIQVYSNERALVHALEQFDSRSTRAWLAGLGIETFTGSSGRVFPDKEIKPVHVLNALKQRMEKRGVSVKVNHEFAGFNAEMKPEVLVDEEKKVIEADHYIFGLGGGSWQKTGASEKWHSSFLNIGVDVFPFEAANCGICIDWDTDFPAKYEGTPLKNIALSAGGTFRKGEALITGYGLEGNAVYPLARQIGKKLKEGGAATLTIDFKPNNTIEQLLGRLASVRLKPKNYAYHFKLHKAVVALVKMNLSKEEYFTPETFARMLKGLTLNCRSLRGVNEAISTVGGISMDEIEMNFTLKKYPSISVVGEMLDWDAPTGGYLLQGCFSTAFVAADHLLE